jgi:integrase
MNTSLALTRERTLQKRTDLQNKARIFIRQSKSDRTLRAYENAWQDFLAFCQAEDLAPLPALPETVSLYIAYIADHAKVSTIQQRLVAISQAHQAAGYTSPTSDLEVRATMGGVRRAKGVAPKTKRATTTRILKQMLQTLPTDTLQGLRDRALLLMGFAGAFRRSELVGLQVSDFAKVEEGYVVTLRRSKTDQEAAGRHIGIPHGTSPETCPVRSLDRWLKEAKITEGYVFRSVKKGGKVTPEGLGDRSVALIVKKVAASAGFDPDQFAGHSLRAGLATAAAVAGVSERKIMDQTGHRSEAMVRRYIRDGNLFRDNAASKVGL